MRENEIKKDNKGFSLVEIIIVLAVMAILTGFLAPQVMTYVEESREAKDLQMVNSVFTAVQTAVALYPDDDITNKTISEAIGIVSKIGDLLGSEMDSVGDIQGKAKSKKGKNGTLYVNYNKSNGKLSVSIKASDGSVSIGPIEND